MLRDVLGIGLALVPDCPFYRESLQGLDPAVVEVGRHKRMPDITSLECRHILLRPLPCPGHNAFILKPSVTESRKDFLKEFPADE